MNGLVTVLKRLMPPHVGMLINDEKDAGQLTRINAQGFGEPSKDRHAGRHSSSLNGAEISSA
jgi:hypothetical protein